MGHYTTAHNVHDSNVYVDVSEFSIVKLACLSTEHWLYVILTRESAISQNFIVSYCCCFVCQNSSCCQYMTKPNSLRRSRSIILSITLSRINRIIFEIFLFYKIFSMLCWRIVLYSASFKINHTWVTTCGDCDQSALTYD